MKLTVLIITKNEEKMLPDCLKSVAWADEVVVVDTGSTDKTISIAKKFGAKVFEYTSGKNFSDWRNFALKKASYEWVLYVDADERVTPELKKEIQETISQDETSSVYAIPRQNIILGKVLKHGGWYPDYVKRLCKKSDLKGWEGDLHENPVVSGKLEHLKHNFIHDKHETIPEMVEKTNNWSEIEAKLMFDAHHPPMNIPRFMSAMWREFYFRMIRKMAFLDGSIGIIMAMYQVYSRFISYAKLWELQNKTIINKSG